MLQHIPLAALVFGIPDAIAPQYESRLVSCRLPCCVMTLKALRVLLWCAVPHACGMKTSRWWWWGRPDHLQAGAGAGGVHPVYHRRSSRPDSIRRDSCRPLRRNDKSANFDPLAHFNVPPVEQRASTLLAGRKATWVVGWVRRWGVGSNETCAQLAQLNVLIRASLCDPLRHARVDTCCHS